MKLSTRPVIYLILSLIGLVFVFYSLQSNKHVLLLVSVLFTCVSVYNIFCGMKSRSSKARK